MAKLQDTKLRGRIQLCFYTAAVNNLKRGIREATPLSKAPERERENIYAGINLTQEAKRFVRSKLQSTAQKRTEDGVNKQWDTWCAVHWKTI